MNTDVLIVGAGPTGLMAANQLMRFGINFIIIDTKNGPTLESRAVVVLPRSLEIYQQLGLSDEIMENCVPVERFSIYSNGKRKGTLEFGNIGQGLSEFINAVTFDQNKNEKLLYQNLKAHGNDVHWNTKFKSLEEHASGINALVERDDKNHRISCKYIIGCDGAKSPVRHQLNFPFQGGTYEQMFFLADTIIKWPLKHDQIIVAPGDFFVGFFPLYGKNRYRVIGTIPPSLSDKENFTFSDIKDELSKTIKVKTTFEKIHWFSIYKLHHRMVDHFSSGRVFLAGDSAHIHSPAGGMGMNTGLQDAYNLTWKMAFVLKGYAHANILNTYNEERLPFAKMLLAFTDRAFSVMTSTHWFIKFFRTTFLLNIVPFLFRFKMIRYNIFRFLGQIGYSYRNMTLSESSHHRNLLFKTGDRLPYLPENKLYDKLQDACFHLLHIHHTCMTIERKKRIQSSCSFPIKIVEQVLDDSWSRYGVREELFVLVRPDNYIGYIADSFGEANMQEYLENFSIPQVIKNKKKLSIIKKSNFFKAILIGCLAVCCRWYWS